MSDDGIFDALVPDTLDLIFALARQFAPLWRARLRCVCRSLHKADPRYVVPAWVHTHPDLLTLPADTPAMRYWTTFVSDACAYVPVHEDEEPDIWKRVARPVEIRWDTRIQAHGTRARARNELRVLWTPWYFNNILHIGEFIYADGTTVLHYAQGSTHDDHSGEQKMMEKWEDRSGWDEYMGSGTCLFQCLSWSMFPPEAWNRNQWPEPIWQ